MPIYFVVEYELLPTSYLCVIMHEKKACITMTLQSAIDQLQRGTEYYYSLYIMQWPTMNLQISNSAAASSLTCRKLVVLMLSAPVIISILTNGHP